MVNFLITCLFVFLNSICLSAYAKTINIQYVKLDVPDDIVFKTIKDVDYFIYGLYKDDINILNIYMGNFPNKNIFERPEKEQLEYFDNYPDQKYSYWNCQNNKEKFCSSTELTFENIKFPSSIQFYYENLDKEYVNIANSIIKSLKGPKISPKPERINVIEKEMLVEVPPCFKVVLPKMTQYYSQCDSEYKYCQQFIRDISTIKNVNNKIGSIKIKTEDVSIINNNNLGKKINLNPFFKKLLNKFPQMKLLVVDYSKNEKFIYSIEMSIPYQYENKKYFLNIDTSVMDKDDASEIIQLLNSLVLKNEKICQAIK